ncbi:MAG: glycosyltransferase family 2 protein [Clostridiales bacterium]|nr:glycosyltransferase family 2 protein [Clostridiales bacterium]
MRQNENGQPKSEPELSIVLVSYNDRVRLGRCLFSLEEEAKNLGAEVVVVDNNSADGSQELVRTSFSWAKLIENSENLGYAKGNNRGIQGSRGKFVLLLNPDTVVPSGALSTLLAELKARPEAGAIGPALVHEDQTFQVSFGRKVSFFSELVQKLARNPYYKARLKAGLPARETGWLSGACLLLRRTALEEAGVFDENFFLFFEDIDLCLRLRKKGFRLIFEPRIKVLHAGGASTSREKLASRLEYRRSQVYFYRKHNSRLSLFLLKIYLRLTFFLQRFFVLRTNEERTLLREKARAIFKDAAHNE